MDGETKRLRSGVTVAIRPGERQRRLDAANEDLAEELKRDYPVVSRAAIAERFPGEWVAIFPTRVDEASRVIAARVFGHAAEREALEEALKPLRQAYPQLSALVVEFTGPVALADPVVHA